MKKLKADCILLAAGASLRMGRQKQLVEIGGKTIFCHSLDLALSCCERVIVVQGAVDLSSEFPRNASVELVHNADYQAGQLGSLQTGIKALRHSLFYVSLADLVLVKPETFFQLYHSIKNHHAVYPVCDNRRGHPVLMGRRAAKLIEAAAPNKKAMDVIQSLNPLPVSVNDRGIFTDIDTEEDLEKVFAERSIRRVPDAV